MTTSRPDTTDATETLTVQRITADTADMDSLDKRFSELPRVRLRQINWATYPYAPDVKVALGYTTSDLAIKFWVREQAVLARHTRPNASVCQDSCVELFFSPDGIHYLNVEMNCIGTVLIGRGTCRQDSRTLAAEQVSRVTCVCSLGHEPFEERRETTSWQLLARIPLDLLELPDGDRLRGQKYRANIYKCGDALSVPHYLTWNPIRSERPDFHRPECFGTLLFE